MELDQLRTLIAAVDGGSFEAAARALSVTPSAVSQRIKALEQQVGVVLLQRSKPVQPTETGLAIARLARQVDLLEREALAALHPRGDEWVSLPLAVNADSLATWVLPALATVPGLAFDIRIEDQDHSTTLLRLGTVMGAVTSDPEPVQGCTVARLGGMRYLAMASPAFRDRWMPHGPTPEALAAAPMVVFNRDDDLQHRYLRSRSRRELSPPTHYVPASLEFLEAVTLGLGWAAIPELQAREHLESGRLVVLDRGHPVDVPLFWQQWSLDSPALSAVASALAAAAPAREGR